MDQRAWLRSLRLDSHDKGLTVASDKEDEKVDTREDADRLDATVCIDANVHDFVPILSCQDLRERDRVDADM